MKEHLSFPTPEKPEDKKQNKAIESLKEKRVYERRPFELPFFHSTHFSNFLKILKDGNISSGYSLIKEGLAPGADFKTKTGGMRSAYDKIMQKSEETTYNGVFFSIGGIPGEGKNIYYTDACPIAFLLDRSGLKHYAFGTTHDVNGDLVVSNKDPEQLTKIKLSDLSAVFIPEDVYFDANGNMINPPYERISETFFAENLSELFKEAEEKLNKYHDIVETIKSAGLKEEVDEEIKNIYCSVLKNAEKDSERSYDKQYILEEIEGLKQYKDQIEWDACLGLLSIDSYYHLMIGKYFNLHGMSMRGSLALGFKNDSDYIKRASLENREMLVKDLALYLFDKLPDIRKGFSYFDQDKSQKYYEKNKEDIDILVKNTNEKLGLNKSDAIDPLDFETFRGRIFYSQKSDLYNFIKLKNEWKTYAKNRENAKDKTFKDYITKIVLEKGGIVHENNDELIIDNYDKINFPPKIIFFKGDLADKINEYTSAKYNISLPEHMLPSDDRPSSQNRTRIKAAETINNELKRLEKKGRARRVGDIPHSFGNTKGFVFKRKNNL